MPTTGSFYNTGVVYGSALWGSFAGNDSGTLALFGGGLSPYGGYTYTSAGGTAALPPAFSAADNMWVNSSGVVAGGDYDGTGNIGEVYNPGTHTTITMPGARCTSTTRARSPEPLLAIARAGSGTRPQTAIGRRARRT